MFHYVISIIVFSDFCSGRVLTVRTVMWSGICGCWNLISGCVIESDYSVMEVLVAPCCGEILLGLVWSPVLL